MKDKRQSTWVWWVSSHRKSEATDNWFLLQLTSIQKASESLKPHAINAGELEVIAPLIKTVTEQQFPEIR